MLLSRISGMARLVILGRTFVHRRQSWLDSQPLLKWRDTKQARFLSMRLRSEGLDFAVSGCGYLFDHAKDLFV